MQPSAFPIFLNLASFYFVIRILKKDEISYIKISLFTLYKKLTQWPSKRGSKYDREEQEEKLINHFW